MAFGVQSVPGVQPWPKLDKPGEHLGLADLLGWVETNADRIAQLLLEDPAHGGYTYALQELLTMILGWLEQIEKSDPSQCLGVERDGYFASDVAKAHRWWRGHLPVSFKAPATQMVCMAWDQTPPVAAARIRTTVQLLMLVPKSEGKQP